MMNEKIAVVGVEVILGGDEGGDAFNRTIFDGIQPPVEATGDPQKKRRAGIKSECKEAYARLLDRSSPPTTISLMSLAIDGALQDSGTEASRDIIADMALIAIAEGDLSSLRSGSRMFLTETSWPQAVQSAQGLLSSLEVRGVVIVAAHGPELTSSPRFHNPQQEGQATAAPVFARNPNGLSAGEGAVAVTLKRVDQAIADQNRIYACLDALVLEPEHPLTATVPSSQKVTEICEKTFEAAGVTVRDIAYLEISRHGIDGAGHTEIEGLVRAYQSDCGGLTCAVGDVTANTGRVSPATGLASLIKTALCLHNRYIPANPLWTGPKNADLWKESPFYVATESRPWFSDQDSRKRVAAISSVEPTGTAHFILSENPDQQPRPNRYLSMVSPYCFPLTGNHQAELMAQLKSLENTIQGNSNLSQHANKTLAAFEATPDRTYALMIVGHSREELLRDIQFMLKAVPSCFENSTDVKTPKGSCFTANPLGAGQSVCFVYPGVGSAYPGLGQSLFHLFPQVYEKFSKRTPRMGGLFRENQLYPRSQEPLTEDELWKMELELRKDIMTIGESGMGFFALYSLILKDCFKITPHCALGYSMGEPGMMASLDVWDDPFQLTERFNNSTIFTESLNGGLSAVREFWGLAPNNPGSEEKIWDSYTLQTTPSVVAAAIKDEPRVYLTIVNTPEEVVIAGDPEDCLQVAKKIGCKFYPLSLNLAIHSAPARLEYDHLVELYTLPVNENPGIRFYSSSCYKAIPIRSKAVANSIARAFSETVDFPRLVNQVYEDGARIFIELGSRKFCSNLIDKILKDKDHLAMAINVKGTMDQISIARVMAQLVTHRVSVDISPLY